MYFFFYKNVTVVITILANFKIPVVPASVVPIGWVVNESVTLVSVVLGSVVCAKTGTKLKVVVTKVFLKLIFKCFKQENHRGKNYEVLMELV